MSAFKTMFGGAMGVVAAICACIAIVAAVFLFLCGGGLWWGAKTVNTAADKWEREQRAREHERAIQGKEEERIQQVKREFQDRDARKAVDVAAVADDKPAVEPAPMVEREKSGRPVDPLGNELSDAEAQILGVQAGQAKPAAKPDDEAKARAQLKMAKDLSEAGKKDAAVKRLKTIVEKFPETESGKEAADLLKK